MNIILYVIGISIITFVVIIIVCIAYKPKNKVKSHDLHDELNEIYTSSQVYKDKQAEKLKKDKEYHDSEVRRIEKDTDIIWKYISTAIEDLEFRNHEFNVKVPLGDLFIPVDSRVTDGILLRLSNLVSNESKIKDYKLDFYESPRNNYESAYLTFLDENEQDRVIRETKEDENMLSHFNSYWDKFISDLPNKLKNAAESGTYYEFNVVYLAPRFHDSSIKFIDGKTRLTEFCEQNGLSISRNPINFKFRISWRNNYED